jgi:hypothetical protein
MIEENRENRIGGTHRYSNISNTNQTILKFTIEHHSVVFNIRVLDVPLSTLKPEHGYINVFAISVNQFCQMLGDFFKIIHKPLRL